MTGLMLAQVFPEQVTAEEFSQSVFYMIATAAVVLAVTGMCLVDAGLVRRKNVLDTCMQKLIGSLIGGGAFAIVGYAIWNWQYLQAFAVPSALKESLAGWWLGGTYLTNYAQNIDPAVVPHADVLQIFLPFNMAFAAVICAFVHSVGIERMKASAFYILSAVIGGILFPFVLYLTWGSVSPLTARGVHDFVGVFPLYIFVGVFGLLLAWRLGPRLGAFTPHPGTEGPSPSNLGLTTVGVALFLFAIPLFAMGCGFFVPGEGYFGIAFTTSGLGITLTNVITAFCAGAVGGAVFGYLSKNIVVAMTSPLAGYIAVASGAEVLMPWHVAIIAFFGPAAAWLVYDVVVHRLQLDERKIIPLGFGAGIYGALAVGFASWGTPTGGYPGIEEGVYAFQGATITPYWQLVGVLVTAGIAIIGGGIVVLALERTVGLRVSEEQELEGLDSAYWRTPGISDADSAPLGPPAAYPAATVRTGPQQT